MFRSTTRLASTSCAGTETDMTDVTSRTREESLYEMIVSMANELKNISKRCDKDRKEFLTRMKEQEQKGFDAASLTKDIQLLVQQITELKGELREKDAVTPPWSAGNNKSFGYLLGRERPTHRPDAWTSH